MTDITLKKIMQEIRAMARETDEMSERRRKKLDEAKRLLEGGAAMTVLQVARALGCSRRTAGAVLDVLGARPSGLVFTGRRGRPAHLHVLP